MSYRTKTKPMVEKIQEIEERLFDDRSGKKRTITDDEWDRLHCEWLIAKAELREFSKEFYD